jgi:hypothetical protein
MDLGWSAYLTLYSMEKNVRSDGTPRINIMQSDLEKLSTELNDLGEPEWAAFIIAYRQNGPYTGDDRPSAVPPPAPDLMKEARYPIRRILDLIGAKTRVQIQGADEPLVLASPFSDDPLAMGSYLPKMVENLTATENQVIPGRININQAPRAILLGIPGMNEEIVDRILADRTADPTTEEPGRSHETWLLSEAVVTLDEMRQMADFITGGGSVYRAQIVGYFEEGGPSARIEAVIDTTGTSPLLLFWRDLSHLGRGFPLEWLGTDAAM